MTSLLSTISNKIYSQFPQNEHAIKASKIESKIEELKNVSPESTLFKNKIADTKNNLAKEKETCLSALIRLNGEFFQDPKSTLKKAWDTVVVSVKEALNVTIEDRNALDNTSTQLASAPQTESTKKASISIDNYKRLEKKRDTMETRLNEILSTEKAAPEAPLSLEALKMRQKELCGDYYEDPKGLLDQAWKEYQDALNQNDGSAEALLEEYNRLETERKNTEALLKKMDSIQPAPIWRTIEVLTMGSIRSETEQLERERERELALAGIDWKKTAAAATGLAGAALITTQF